MKSNRMNVGLGGTLVVLAGVGVGVWLLSRAKRRKADRADAIDHDGRRATFADSDPRGAGSDSGDIVQEASEESFPASDPPPWTAGARSSG